MRDIGFLLIPLSFYAVGLIFAVKASMRHVREALASGDGIGLRLYGEHIISALLLIAPYSMNFGINMFFDLPHNGYLDYLLRVSAILAALPLFTLLAASAARWFRRRQETLQKEYRFTPKDLALLAAALVAVAVGGPAIAFVLEVAKDKIVWEESADLAVSIISTAMFTAGFFFFLSALFRHIDHASDASGETPLGGERHLSAATLFVLPVTITSWHSYSGVHPLMLALYLVGVACFLIFFTWIIATPIGKFRILKNTLKAKGRWPAMRRLLAFFSLGLAALLLMIDLSLPQSDFRPLFATGALVTFFACVLAAYFLRNALAGGGIAAWKKALAAQLVAVAVPASFFILAFFARMLLRVQEGPGFENPLVIMDAFVLERAAMLYTMEKQGLWFIGYVAYVFPPALSYLLFTLLLTVPVIAGFFLKFLAKAAMTALQWYKAAESRDRENTHVSGT